jgi:hypothetical protein
MRQSPQVGVEGAFSIVNHNHHKYYVAIGWHERAKKWPMKTGALLIDGLDEKAEGDMTMMTTAMTVLGWYCAISAISIATVLAWGRERARRKEQ